MSRPDISIDPKLLESAKEEFLSKGFLEASLKTICDNAGVTTGALYKRYKGKEELFCAVVAHTVADLEDVIQEKAHIDFSDVSDEALVRAWYMDEAYMLWWFQFLYDRHDGFVLLLKCAEGTRYSNFEHDWVEQMTESTWKYYREAYDRNLCRADISRKEMHALLSVFWTTIYEPFIHDYSWEQIEEHSNLVCRLINWFDTLEFSEEAVQKAVPYQVQHPHPKGKYYGVLE